ncbi:hypothetical protein M0R72_08710 [Candidatus Pacearchaeota archaeon]|jgi:hypothetical protein|nr:hypothetical protein [Candidatus Pacearchaeota archaeon]
MKLLIIFLLLSLAAGSDMQLYVAGNFTGSGFNETIIEVPGANITGNNSSWMIVWEDATYDGWKGPDL